MATAEALLQLKKGKPTQAALRRAMSTVYFALFHHLARNCADQLIGTEGADRSNPAWRQTYRAIDHGVVKNACKDTQMRGKFPPAIRVYAESFVTMQEKRHAADYHPAVQLSKSEVQQEIENIRQVIKDFDLESAKDRCAFAAYVLFKKRF